MKPYLRSVSVHMRIALVQDSKDVLNFFKSSNTVVSHICMHTYIHT